MDATCSEREDGGMDGGASVTVAPDADVAQQPSPALESATSAQLEEQSTPSPSPSPSPPVSVVRITVQQAADTPSTTPPDSSSSPSAPQPVPSRGGARYISPPPPVHIHERSTRSAVATPADSGAPAATAARVTAGEEDAEEDGASPNSEFGSDESESEDADSNSHDSAISIPSKPPFESRLPAPLLFCLTLLGCTFVLASLVLHFGTGMMSSWTEREQSVAYYNRAVRQWSAHDSGGGGAGGGYAGQMARARFSVLDLRRPDEAAMTGAHGLYGNDTWLRPVTVQTHDTGSVSAYLDDDDEHTGTSAAAAAAATAEAAAPRNANGLRDTGSDVLVYKPLYYEALLPSPLSLEEGSPDGATDSPRPPRSDGVDRYWSRLLSHDLRTLVLQTWLDGLENTRLNLTIPLLRRETTPHLTRHACETTMAGMFDRNTRTCAFFSQLHSICLRVKLLTPTGELSYDGKNAPTTTGAAAQQTLQWSFDAREIGINLTEPPRADESDSRPLTSLTVASATTSAAAAASAAASNNATEAAAPTGVSGCIWDRIASRWRVAAYHAVDLRSERQFGSDGVNGAESESLPPQLEQERMLRITIKSTHDPFLLAQHLTRNILWFGLARTEKLLLSAVLAVVGCLILLMPAHTLVRYLSIRSAHFRRSKRARRGGYLSVMAVGGASGGGGGRASPVSPSSHALVGADADQEEEDETREDGVQLVEMSKHRSNANGNPRGSAAGPALAPTDDDARGCIAGFVPSDALRHSLVSSPDGNTATNGHTVGAGGAGTGNRNGNGAHAAHPMFPSAPRAKRIRIDPAPRFPDPVHQPATPTRAAVAPALSKRSREYAAAARAAFAVAAASPRQCSDKPKSRVPTGQSTARASRPAPDRHLGKILSGRFSFAALYAAWSGRGATPTAAATTTAAAGGLSTQRRDVAEFSFDECVEHNVEVASSPISASDEARAREREMTRALAVAALHERTEPENGTLLAHLDCLASPISPIVHAASPSQIAVIGGATLTPWSSPR